MKKIYILSFNFIVALFLINRNGFSQTPVPMSSQPGLSYTENFADIANWTNAFASGIGANRFGAVAVNATGTIPDGIKTTAATSTFATGSSGGVQKGTAQTPSTQSIVLLSTGATDNTSSCAIDFLMDYTGVNAGTLSFDWAAISNSTGDRKGSLRVYYSTNGTSFTELTTAQVLNITNNVATSGSITTVALPAAFNNSATARLRFYYYNGTGGASGSRPKINIDNLNVTALPSGNTVSVAAGLNAAEAPSPTAGTFTITFNTATTATTTIDYAYTGTATFGTDYTVSYSSGTPGTATATGTLTVPSGITTITVTITPIDDAIPEGIETVIAGLSNPTGGYSIGTGSATINITDDDLIPTVSVAPGTNATEPSTNGTFLITLSAAAPAGGVTITYSLSGTATFNTDYTDPQSGSITIPQGSTNGTITMNVTDDTIPEADETIILTINGATSPYTIGTGTATINLISDDITPVSLTGSIYSQDFNTLPSTGTATLYSLIPSGWGFIETGTAANTTYTAGTGSSNTGDTYSFGAASNSERAFGGLRTGSLVPVFGASFKNNTGSTVTSFKIIYTGEQWRLGATGRNDKIDFQYSLDATGLATGTWVDADALDFTAPNSTGTVGAFDGNASGNRTTLSFTVTGISIANGATFFIRWTDLDAAGADDGLAVDDFSIETNPADPDPPVISSLSPANSSINVPVSFTAVATFNENIQKGTGNILVKKTSDNSIFQTISIASASVTVSGNTASFSISGLSANTGYYIEIAAGGFKDLANNNFAGITGSSTWGLTTGTLLYSASFNSCSSTPTEGFIQYSVAGPQVWACTTFGTDASHTPTGSAANGVQINGFSTTNIPNEDWLISPSFDLTASTYPLLSYWSRTKFNGLPLQLKVSINYTSGDPTAATWTDLNGKFPDQTTDVWTLSNNINLAAFKTTNVHFAFVYYSSNDDGARWTLDDIQLDNSATLPPPTLTTSTNDIQFGYAAAGNTVTKTFTVTGNDITGDITLTATSSFGLSTALAGPFTSSVTLLQASANNIPTTIYVRFSPAINNQNITGTVTVTTAGVSNVTINLKGSTIDPANTLEAVNWNMEWFGSTTLGPVDDAQQQANAQTILQNIGADIFGLVEVVDETRLATIVSNMPGYSYVICNYGSHTNTNEPGATLLSEAQKEVFVYKTALFSNITTAPLVSQGINSAADLSNPAYNYFASGRFPYMMKADVTLNGTTKTIRFVLLHAKANTSPTATSYARRKSGSDTLKYTLNNLYPNDNIVVLGDINDDLDSTITDGINPRITSYSAFRNDTVTTFTSPTLALSLAGKKSTVSYNDVIDHVILSNEMQRYYMPGTANILSDVTSLVTNYGTTTSDHYPVFTRYSFDQNIILPVLVSNFNAVKEGNKTKLSWTTAQEINSRQFIVERSANGSAWQSVVTVTAAGNSSATIDYSVYDAVPLKGTNLYRLKAIDIDNKFDYSATRRVNFDIKSTYSIYPNPATNLIQITVDNSSSVNTSVEILNIQSQVLLKKQVNTTIQPVQVDISRLQPGTYFIKITTADGAIHVEKLVKQ